MDIKRLCIVALFLLLLPGLRAQVLPPQPPPPKPKVTTTRFAPLVKGEFIPKPRGGGFVQQTTDAITCTFDPANLTDNYTILHYHWGGLDFGPNPPDGPTAVGVLHQPGTFSVAVTLDVVAKAPGSQPSTAGPYTSKSIYVVGGPLALGVSGGVQGTP